jgi:hypothetical protein
MTFEDAHKILDGGDTAATDYFRGKTRKQLYDEFRPVVSASMDEVGVTHSYKNMVGKYAALPLAGKTGSVDLDHHVTTKALDGLFLVLGQEEKKIRTDPAARVTASEVVFDGGKTGNLRPATASSPFRPRRNSMRPSGCIFSHLVHSLLYYIHIPRRIGTYNPKGAVGRSRPQTVRPRRHEILRIKQDHNKIKDKIRQ